MKAEIVKEYLVPRVYEIYIEWNGYGFLTIYGQHKNNDWFVAFPELGISERITEPTDIYYNINKLSEVFNNGDKGKAVAEAIREHYETINKDNGGG